MEYSRTFKIGISGRFACFTDPAFNCEKTSYPIPTESAARGIISSIHWKPSIKWKIDRIHVINPVEYYNLILNQLKTIPANGRPFNPSLYRSQRNYRVILNPKYIIEACFSMTGKVLKDGNIDNDIKKHECIMTRRLNKGQSRNIPYLGIGEFSADYFGTANTIPKSKIEGTTIYKNIFQQWDHGNSPPTAIYSPVIMENGIISFNDKKGKVKK